MVIEDLGRLAYQPALEKQLQLVEAVRSGHAPDTLLLVEHDPVFTIGARHGAASHLLWSTELLQRHGITVHTTNRGGDITYHGPGQIVGYPIINLCERRDLHAYLRDLEEVLIRTVAAFGVAATRRPGLTGIWIADRKIAAIGIAVKQWVAYHGFALNVNPNLDHFTGIVPCGITQASVTSLARECQSPPSIEQVKASLVPAFRAVFSQKSSKKIQIPLD